MKDLRRGLLATLPLAPGVVAFGLLYGVVESFRERGCLRMKNGEASTLFAVTQALGVLGGVLFQPRISS